MIGQTRTKDVRTQINLESTLREGTHKNFFFFFSGQTTMRGGEGVKPPEPLRKKHFFFYDLKRNVQNLMKHKKKY